MAGARVVMAPRHVQDRVLEDVAAGPGVEVRLRATGEAVAADAARMAPVLTGTLRRSLTVDRDRLHSSYRVGWDTQIADYGPIVEGGTVYTPAQPHLGPAARGRAR